MRITYIDIPELGNRTYIVDDGFVAVVVDAPRRTAVVKSKAQELQVKIVAVLETHIHNDYVTGGLRLATAENAEYGVAAEDTPTFDRKALKPGDELRYGNLVVSVMASPGHTYTHLSYLITDSISDDTALFSGGSLLYGSVGRTDLLGLDHTANLTKAQFESAQTFAELPDDTPVYPTHGFGSFCSSAEAEAVDVSTIGEQKQSNYVYFSSSFDEFKSLLLESLDAYPRYYAHMAPANLKGPQAPLLEAKELTASDIDAVLHKGGYVVDMRSRSVYANHHAAGTFNIESGKDFMTYVGWLIPWESDLVLIGDSSQQVADGQEQLSLIGRERLTGRADVKELESLISSTYKVATFADLKQALNGGQNVVVLDIRRNNERKKGYIQGSMHIPLHELLERADELEPGNEYWVHCDGGFRAAIAASIIDAIGKKKVFINDEFINTLVVGLPIAADV